DLSFRSVKQKNKDAWAMPKDVLVSDAAILLPAGRIVNRQFAKKRKDTAERFFVKISLRLH
ncbi:MAG: hypothetical protein IKX47_01320, partial [Oscillospiraceae bacterium]|nr:hypothetical protein [Oscillospiraceae bacterium]